VASTEVKILWSDKATAHLHPAYDYWAAEKSRDSADTMLDRIFSSIEMLERHPAAGRHGRIPGTRELLILPTPLLIAYRVQNGTIQIIGLLHAKRKWPQFV